MPANPAAVKALFLEAAAIDDPAARAALVNDRCREDAALRARVDALLVANDRAVANEGNVDGGDARPTIDFAGQDERVGATLAGKYKLIEEIGEGGMGSVFMAQQTEPVKRAVAVKVIKAGMDSRAVLARFEAERQALAMMDHPNIARVLDAGTTDRGRPFFVMDLVKGMPITQFCDERKLTLRQRLELFVPVCQAIQHAHQKGIIHRDIKPSNVLVALYDDRAVPKVIDFGVAKAAGQALTDRTLMTGFGAVVGTPEYMSPEQASLNNLDVDTRSDVYSLGVLLYELLTGTTPVDRKSLGQAAMLEILRIVREVDTPRPSAKLSTIDTLPNVAANRGTDPTKLSKFIKGELDWLVLKALEKDRTRRYDTANGLGRDIQRYLADEVVEARPPSAGYRLEKFVRRHKGQILAASLLLVALLAGMAGTTWGLIEAKKQELIAKRHEQIAREETTEKEKARLAEAERVQERDKALAQADEAIKNEMQRVKERDKALGQAEEAIKNEAQRVKERDYQLGIGNFLLAVAAYDGCNLNLASERLDKVPTDQRGWEWAFLKRQTRGGIFTLYGHTNHVLTVSYSPDGTRLVTGSGDGTAKVWDARTGTPLLDLIGHAGGVNSVSFSPDGTRIITGGRSFGKPGEAKVWDTRTGTPLLDLKGHTEAVWSANFSPDGARIVTSSQDKTAKVWDANTGTSLLDLTGHTKEILTASFSPDGTRIVTSSGDGTPKVWDARRGAALLDLTGQKEYVWSASFSPDGARIVTSGGSARIWDASTGAVLLALTGQPEYVWNASFSPDGTRIVTCGAELARIWDARTGKSLLELKGHTNAVRNASFSPDGAQIVTGSYDKTAKVWDARTGTPFLDLKPQSAPVWHASFPRNGTRIVTSGGESATIWDARTGSALVDLKGHTDIIRSVSFSLDGARIVTGSQDKTAKVWDGTTGAPLLELRGHTGSVEGVSFSPDGTRIVTSSFDKTAKVWNGHTGAPLLKLMGHTDFVTSVCFSPDGKRILSGSGDTTAKVWDALTGAPLLDLKGHTNGIDSVSFAPDGTHCLTGSRDKTAKVWDARTGEPLLELKGHTNALNSASFSPDGMRIVTSSLDTAKVWDARTGTPLLDVKGLTNSVLFSPDGARIVTCAGTFARIWDTRTGQELKGDQKLDADELEYRLFHTRPNASPHGDRPAEQDGNGIHEE